MEEKRCEVHDVPLKPDRVPILYGLYRYPEDFLEAWKREFPHAKLVRFGGCFVGKEDEGEILFCSACRVALRSWNTAHGSEYAEPPGPETLAALRRHIRKSR